MSNGPKYKWQKRKKKKNVHVIEFPLLQKSQRFNAICTVKHPTFNRAFSPRSVFLLSLRHETIYVDFLFIRKVQIADRRDFHRIVVIVTIFINESRKNAGKEITSFSLVVSWLPTDIHLIGIPLFSSIELELNKRAHDHRRIRRTRKEKHVDVERKRRRLFSP